MLVNPTISNDDASRHLYRLGVVMGYLLVAGSLKVDLKLATDFYECLVGRRAVDQAVMKLVIKDLGSIADFYRDMSLSRFASNLETMRLGMRDFMGHSRFESLNMKTVLSVFSVYDESDDAKTKTNELDQITDLSSYLDSMLRDRRQAIHQNNDHTLASLIRLDANSHPLTEEEKKMLEANKSAAPQAQAAPVEEEEELSLGGLFD